jgi:8-oxo-dGTP pyrophosphatase MutT (NUDIX family)
VEEETGWRPGPLTLLTSFASDHGITDSHFHLYRADGASYQVVPKDAAEAAKIEWIRLAEVRSMTDAGEISDGASLTALLLLLLGGAPSRL